MELRIREFAGKHKVSIILSAAGAAAGFFYWKFIGCKTGTCPIKSVWYLMTLYGLLLGWVVGGLAEDIILKFFKHR
jgi:hypothetical protein